jgi:hypothetical protein
VIKIKEICGFAPIYVNSKKYEYDVVTVRDFNGRFKIVRHNALRIKGVEDVALLSPKGSVSSVKSENNISRAKSRVFELALCNDWTIFLTFTLDPEKYNRDDLKKFQKDVSQFIRNYNRLHGLSIKYLLIPEEHKKGGWHMHGFLMGLPKSHLRRFELKEKLPRYIREKIKVGQEIYEWQAYRKKFGFCDLEPVKDSFAVSAYVTKYITKDLDRTVKESGAHLYYCSQGLSRSSLVFVGKANEGLVYDYESEYNSVKWLPVGTSMAELTHYVHQYDSIERLKKQARDSFDGFMDNFDLQTGEIYYTPFDD